MHLKRIIISFTSFVILGWAFPFSVKGKTMTAIVFAQTNDEKIGASCEVDFENIVQEIDSISLYGGFDLTTYYFKHRECNCENLKNVVDNLPQSDIVYFYYVGHGFESKIENDSFPVLQICNSLDLSYSHYAYVGSLTKLLKEKSNQATYIFTDCCNRGIGGVPPLVPAAVNINLKKRFNYKKLYTDFHGTVIVSAASPSQSSWGNPDDGGLFTKVFFETFQSLTKDLNPDQISWELILNSTRSKVLTLSNQRNNVDQRPMWVIEK